MEQNIIDLRKATGKKLIEAFERGDLQSRGRCQYQDLDNRPCAVGYLMAAEVREELVNFSGVVSRFANDDAYGDLAVGFPDLAKRLSDETGLSTQELCKIQKAFDGADDRADFMGTVRKITGYDLEG